jgi:hypothetical protein
MPTPIATAPRCDVDGCSFDAVKATDGTESDITGLARPAVPHVNVCAHHDNWPHSEDAQRFAASDVYRNRITPRT